MNGQDLEVRRPRNASSNSISSISSISISSSGGSRNSNTHLRGLNNIQ